MPAGTLASSPETADWCVLYRDATWVMLPEDDPYAASAPTWINGRCRDISKRTVQRVFAEVFGYPLAIDPLDPPGGLCAQDQPECRQCQRRQGRAGAGRSDPRG